MKNILVLLFVLVTSSLFSQSKPFQIDLGLNQSWIYYYEGFGTINDIKPDFRPKLSAAVSYNYPVCNAFTTNAGLRYFHLGRAFDFDFDTETRKVSIDHYLLSLPLQLKYNISYLSTDVLLNAEPAFILKSTVNDYRPERDVTKEMRRLQFLMGVGLEYHFNIGQEMFGIRSIYNFGLTIIPKDQYNISPEGYLSRWVSYDARELNVSLSYFLE